MQLGKLSFCDRIGNNIRDSDTKELILNEIKRLTSPEITGRAWNTWNASNRLPNDLHAMCLRTNGNPYLMCILNIGGVNRVVFIDRKVNKSGTYMLPRMILANVFFPSNFFTGTVLDGELVRSGVNRWVYLVNGCICLEGMRVRTLHDRVMSAHRILEARSPSYADPCEFQIKRWFPVSQDGYDNIVEFSTQLPYTSRGIYIFTTKSWTPWLFNYDNSLVQTKVRIAKTEERFRNTVSCSTEQTPVINSSTDSVSDGTKIRVESTDTPDLFLCEDATELDIPNLKTSLFMSNMFARCQVGTPKEIVCVRSNDSLRWRPIVA